MKKVLMYLWQLPQHLLGLALIRLLKAKKYSWRRGYGCIYVWGFVPKGRFGEFISGVSLGKYIILKPEPVPKPSIEIEKRVPTLYYSN